MGTLIILIAVNDADDDVDIDADIDVDVDADVVGFLTHSCFASASHAGWQY